MPQELLLFEIADGTFGVPTQQVREVLRAAALFPLPEYPEIVAGGLNLRGEIVPVVEGRAVLSLAGKPMDPADHLIVLGVQAGSIAIHVDRALALSVARQEDQVEAAPGRFIIEIVNTDSGPAAILNVSHLLECCRPVASSCSSPEAEP